MSTPHGGKYLWKQYFDSGLTKDFFFFLLQHNFSFYSTAKKQKQKQNTQKDFEEKYLEQIDEVRAQDGLKKSLNKNNCKKK